ncbi:M48 family metalloprotease [Spirosoma validum]|uniref:M48 family metalloprotease n=1 Tax=Spirosoma validum TaxID=2771355 RepID=A0A927GBP9_9BACT|nr:M48 family metalloprotease [Spirosoma validum]MBD2751853.1 M48 family metalloprotease [Spirosoma validum]
MRIGKIAWLYGLFFLTINVSAQDCGCDRIAKESRERHLYSETRAQAIVDTFCRLFIHPAKVYPKPYACNRAIFAAICDATKEKYIFYDEPFLNRLLNQSKWGDRFVLAHEIAHHLLGHTERAYRLGPIQKQLNTTIDQTKYRTIDRSGTKKDYVITIPQRHLHELEADALGLWMIVNPQNKRKATQSDIQEIFRALPQLLSVYSNADEHTTTNSHPSLFIRRKLIERYWSKYENPDFVKRYAAIDDGENYKALEGDTEEFYAFQLINANAEQQAQLNDAERIIRDSLTRRSRFFVDILVGGMTQIPVLSRDGNVIAATNNRTLTGGLRLGVGPWYKPFRFETDLKVAGSTFTTQAVLADGLRTTEQFRTTYLYIQPRYVYSRINRLAKYAYRAGGLMATLGASVSLPLRYEYTNYVAANYKAVPQNTGITGVVGLGYGLSNWRNSNGHFRLWLLYQPQPLRLATEPSENVSAWLHTFSLDFSFRFW